MGERAERGEMAATEQRDTALRGEHGQWATRTRRNENVTGLIPADQGGVNNAITITGLTGATADYTYTAKG